ncbi:ribosome maturation factor RimM [Chloroflexota bacterium]
MKPSGPEFITIGKILSSWGTEGQLRVQVTTDFPQRFAPSSRVHLQGQLTTIESVIWRKGQAIIKLDIVDDVETADKLRGEFIEIHNSRLQSLPDGQYYHFELVGLEVRTTQEELLGKVTEIISVSSNDIYVVKGKDGEFLIPAIDDVVKSIDRKKKRIIIEPMKGLLGLNQKAAK